MLRVADWCQECAGHINVSASNTVQQVHFTGMMSKASLSLPHANFYAYFSKYTCFCSDVTYVGS